MPVARMRDYVRVVRGLLAGEEVAYTADGVTHLIRFQNSRLGHHDAPIPIQIGALGPLAQALAGEVGDGIVTSMPRGGTPTSIRANLDSGAARTARQVGPGFEVVALLNLVLLAPGQTLASEEVIADCGSAIMANVHYLVDRYHDTGAEPPAYVLPIWEEYLAFHRSRDADRAHQQLHQSHYAYLDRDEARFITPEIIRNFCVAGPATEVVEQLHALEGQGITGVNFIYPDKARYRLTEEVARQVIARY
jgi:alkanesulfonate monooxygenase SsuD/methylene tetrahydromethanopterin reductase-like flavin-dependent oxidoreductase (luciferase family)